MCLPYTGGVRAELPIVYGQQVRNWWSTGGEAYEAQKAQVVWKGSNPATESQNASLRIFECTQANPQPEQRVQSVDFVSARTDSAPFLIAITLD